MDKINALLADLENKIKENILEISNLRNVNDELRAQNIILSNEKDDAVNNFKQLDKRFKALKVANTISGSKNNINETRNEINLLIKEIDLCISQLSD